MNSLIFISFAIFATAFAGHHGNHGNETDDRPPCSCDQMKTCLQEKLQAHDELRTVCDQQCSNTLPHQNEMKQCLTAKWTKTDEMLQKMLDCVTTGDQNMCQNSGQKREDSQKTEEEEEKKKSEMIEEIKPYVDCMKRCMNTSEDQENVHKYDKEAKERHDSGHGWKHFMSQMWSGVRKCKKSLNCKLDHDTKKAAMENCMKSTGVGKESYCTVKHDFCTCARGALGKTEEEMPCTSEDGHTEEPHMAVTHGHE